MAGVAANEAQEDPVRAHAPQSALAGIEPVLDGRCGRAPAAICRQMSARAIEIVGRRHNHDRHPAVDTFECHRKLPLAAGAGADAAHISEAKHLAQ
jgi:hypothetical protein